MAVPIAFSETDRIRLERTLARFPGIDTEEARAIISDIGAKGSIRAFGYGSLVDNPHTEIDRKIRGQLPGWLKGFNCLDTHYRGTKQAPGLTLGLDKSDTPEAVTNGAILENRIQSADEAIDFLEKFADREIPPGMDIYTFAMIEVETDRGPMTGLVCVANPDSDLYVGRHYSVEQKAELAAERIGDRRYDEDGRQINAGRGKRTSFQYAQNAITNDLELGREPLPEMMAIFLKAGQRRAAMDPARRAALEALERPLTDAQRNDVAAAARRLEIMDETALATAMSGLIPLDAGGAPAAAPTRPGPTNAQPRRLRAAKPHLPGACR